MKKSELITKIQQRFNYLPVTDVHRAVQLILTRMSNSIATKGHKIEIRQFGSFGSRVRPARGIRNPKTGEKLQRGPKAVPFFKAAANLRELVDYKSGSDNGDSAD